MTISDYLTWEPVPEFVLGNFWHIEIEETLRSTPWHKVYMTEQMLDNAISEITFPQEELTFEQTSFGLPILNSMKDFETVSITYYDYVETPIGLRLPITSFFRAWMDELYDRNKRCVKKTWRTHFKTIKATLSRFFKTGALASLASSALNQGASALGPVASIPSVVLDAKETKVITYKMENCYISKLNEISLNESDGERKEFTVELICDRVTPISPVFQ